MVSGYLHSCSDADLQGPGLLHAPVSFHEDANPAHYWLPRAQGVPYSRRVVHLLDASAHDELCQSSLLVISVPSGVAGSIPVGGIWVQLFHIMLLGHARSLVLLLGVVNISTMGSRIALIFQPTSISSDSVATSQEISLFDAPVSFHEDANPAHYWCPRAQGVPCDSRRVAHLLDSSVHDHSLLLSFLYPSIRAFIHTPYSRVQLRLFPIESY